MRTAVVTVAALGEKQLGTFLGWLTAALLLVGALLFLFRLVLEKQLTSGKEDSADRTLVRSWVAMALVSGLLIFSAASFFLDDTTLRSLLLGGVVSSAGTATAFYFASKAAEQTQQNLLSAALGGVASIPVPDLAGLKVSEARLVLGALGLKRAIVPDDAADEAPVDHTVPPKDAGVKRGDSITAYIT